jgi:hypothetical protein
VLLGDPFPFGAPLHLSHDQQGPPELEGHRELLVVAEGLLQRLHGIVGVAAGGQQQRPAAGGGS